MSSGRPNFPQIEEEILDFWEGEDIFKKTLAKDAPKGNFVFFEGPPTANGKPGIHHVEARAFKDAIPRYKTMQGFHVARKGGWDTHGLPVEIEVEKKLDLHSKIDVEKYGIKEFNEKCKESVWEYLEDWIGLTKRIAYWLDLDNAYITYKPEYVESLWWILSQVWERDLMYQDYKVVPYCTRCGTTLSSHEVAQGYKEVEDPAIYVQFKVTKKIDGSEPDNEYLVAWTTTPWTLISNTALAVGTEINYVKVSSGDKLLWIARDRVEEATQGDYEVLEEVRGKDLVGTEYEPLFPYWDEARAKADIEGKAHYVVPADFVSTEDGSGIVHTAVMYGADDFALGNEVGLPKFHMVGLDGHFIEETGPYSGMYIKKTDALITEDLEKRGLLLKGETIKHTYPFCWRCKSPLVYYAKDSWYIRMSDLRDEMVAENEQINWEPKHIQQGRFGEWLREIKDWAISRERYWGTPLPIWVCEECGEPECVGSFEQLKKLGADIDPKDFDPHRPYVDEVELACGKCGGTARRIPDVCDVWFDSGCMPFAQWHYPFENKELIDNGDQFPGDYISEAIDQTRGWFYTLHAVGNLLGKGHVYKNCICLGHLLDAKGKKMSKSLGNIVDPVEQINKYGADAVRWWMYTVNQPGESKNYDERDVDTIVKKVFMILWNVKVFYEQYEQKHGKSNVEVGSSKNVLDAWILARLNQLVAESTESLDNYKLTEPVRNIGEFINELSTWYVRRSRDRFKSEDEAERDAAMATLKHCLIEITKLMAPFAPFISDAVYHSLEGGEQSVHLADWPVADEKLINKGLLENMDQVRELVSLGQKERENVKIPVKQVLSTMTVQGMAELGVDLQELIKDEVNVKHVEFVEKGDLAVELDTNITPELAREGMVREVTRKVNGLRKEMGLTIEDTIVLNVHGDDEVAKMLEEHGEAIAKATLAQELRTEHEDLKYANEFEANGHKIWIGIKKQ